MNFSISNLSSFPMILWLAPDILCLDQKINSCHQSLLAWDVFSLEETSDKTIGWLLILVYYLDKVENMWLEEIQRNRNTSSDSHKQAASAKIWLLIFTIFFPLWLRVSLGREESRAPRAPQAFRYAWVRVSMSPSTGFTASVKYKKVTKWCETLQFSKSSLF